MLSGRQKELIKEWEESLGKLLPEESILIGMNISKEELDQLIKNNKIIALPVAGHSYLFPKFQFNSNGKPNQVLCKAFKYLTQGYSEWPAASWFGAVDNGLDNLSPIQYLKTNNDKNNIIIRARQDGRAGSR